jgi:hypothetical protein
MSSLKLPRSHQETSADTEEAELDEACRKTGRSHGLMGATRAVSLRCLRITEELPSLFHSFFSPLAFSTYTVVDVVTVLNKNSCW